MSVKKLNLLFVKFVLYFFLVNAISDNNGNNRRQHRRGGKMLPPRSFLRSYKWPLHIVDEAEFLPESFDAREIWPECPSIGRIEDQGDCHSNWAVIAASTITDRWCIDSKGRDQFEFSAGDLLTCCDDCHDFIPDSDNETVRNRCSYGGDSDSAIEYWIKTGIVSGSGRELMKGCKPYSTIVQKKGGAVNDGICLHSCTNPNYSVPYDDDIRSGKDCGVWWFGSITALQTEIMIYGPVIGSIYSTKHFVENGGRGIYREPEKQSSDSDDEINYQYVKIIGWGIERSTERSTERGIEDDDDEDDDDDDELYWLAANSLGPDWGAEKGFFKVLRGQRAMHIEDFAHAPYVKEMPRKNEDRSSAANILYCMLTHYFVIFSMFMYFFL